MQRHSPTSFIHPKGPALWIIGILTFTAVHTLSSFFAQKRGIPAEHLPLSTLGFFLGFTVGSLLLPPIERYMPVNTRFSRILRCVVLVGLFSPALTSLFLQVTGAVPQPGTAFTNFIQPALWATLLPVAGRLLFHPALTGMHAALLGLSASLLSIIWTLISPLSEVGSIASEVQPDFFAQVYLPLINTARAMFCVAFVVIAWELLIAYPHPKITPKQTVPLQKAIPFALLSILCFLLQGIVDFMLNAQLNTLPQYKPYANIILAGSTLFVGLWVNKKGTGRLHLLIGGTQLLLSVAAVCLVLPFISPTAPAFILFINVKIQTFLCLLVFGLFSLRCNKPHIALWLGLAIPALSLFSRLAMHELANQLPAEQFTTTLLTLLYVSAALCLLGLPFITRACNNMFSTLPLQATAEEQNGKAPLATAQPKHYRTEKINEFAEKYKLSNREVQILEMLAQGLSSSDMAEQINLRESTVRTYAQGLLRKTGAKSRLLLVAALAAEDDSPQEQQHEAMPE